MRQGAGWTGPPPPSPRRVPLSSGFRVQSSGLRVCRVYGLGFRIQSVGFRV
jgi:hypothetical protein